MKSLCYAHLDCDITAVISPGIWRHCAMLTWTTRSAQICGNLACELTWLLHFRICLNSPGLWRHCAKFTWELTSLLYFNISLNSPGIWRHCAKLTWELTSLLYFIKIWTHWACCLQTDTWRALRPLLFLASIPSVDFFSSNSSTAGWLLTKKQSKLKNKSANQNTKPTDKEDQLNLFQIHIIFIIKFQPNEVICRNQLNLYVYSIALLIIRGLSLRLYAMALAIRSFRTTQTMTLTQSNKLPLIH